MTLLDVDALSVSFRTRRSLVRRELMTAVRDVSFHIAAGETLGLVGESGSGKSTIGRAVLHLLRPQAGTITFSGRELTAIRGRLPDDLRRAIQAVFQDPYSSLDPTKVIADLVAEPLVTHLGLGRRERRERAAHALERVGLERRHLERYPYELSGGQRQRVCIARALLTEPSLIVLDEPVSALDVSTQSQVINLLADVQADTGVGYLFIAHDLTVVRHLSHRIAALYRGRIVEDGDAERVADRPAHPYTQALVASVPVPDPVVQTRRRDLRRRLLTAAPQHAAEPADGCPFAPRCSFAFEPCWTTFPVSTPVVGGGHVRCHLYDQTATTPQPIAAGLGIDASLTSLQP